MSKQIYQLSRIDAEGNVEEITSNEDAAYIYAEQARMNAHAPDGIIYSVDVVEPVTRPLRLVVSNE